MVISHQTWWSTGYKRTHQSTFEEGKLCTQIQISHALKSSIYRISLFFIAHFLNSISCISNRRILRNSAWFRKEYSWVVAVALKFDLCWDVVDISIVPSLRHIWNITQTGWWWKPSFWRVIDYINPSSTGCTCFNQSKTVCIPVVTTKLSVSLSTNGGTLNQDRLSNELLYMLDLGYK